MRLALSLSVIFFHSVEFDGKSAQLPFLSRVPLNALELSVLPMFFALSGFLVAGSLERTRSMIGFVGLRALRIFPALAVDTLFSALALGLFFTNLSWHDYFARPAFRAYLLNMLGDIHYFLPGVFLGNPTSYVNAQLWTVPYELLCYVALVTLVVTGIYRRPLLLLMVAVLPICIGAGPSAAMGHLGGRLLVSSFLLGATTYLVRNDVPWNPWLCAFAIATTIAMVSVPHLYRLLPISLTYVTVFLGTLQPNRVWPLTHGDYSYGMYLYGFPISQALVASVASAHAWYFGFAFTVVTTGLFAAFSWHVIEKRCLALRPLLFRLESWLLAARYRIGFLVKSRPQQTR